MVDQRAHVASVANQRIVLEPHVQNAMQLGGQGVAEAGELVARNVQQLYGDKQRHGEMIELWIIDTHMFEYVMILCVVSYKRVDGPGTHRKTVDWFYHLQRSVVQMIAGQI